MLHLSERTLPIFSTQIEFLLWVWNGWNPMELETRLRWQFEISADISTYPWGAKLNELTVVYMLRYILTIYVVVTSTHYLRNKYNFSLATTWHALSSRTFHVDVLIETICWTVTRLINYHPKIILRNSSVTDNFKRITLESCAATVQLHPGMDFIKFSNEEHEALAHVHMQDN